MSRRIPSARSERPVPRGLERRLQVGEPQETRRLAGPMAPPFHLLNSQLPDECSIARPAYLKIHDAREVVRVSTIDPLCLGQEIIDTQGLQVRRQPH